MEVNWNLSINFLAAILAIVNPIGIIPIWQELTGDAHAVVRKKIALMVTTVSLGILLIFLNTGSFLLEFFGINLDVFKIAGGILLLLTAISMIEGKATQLEDRDEKSDSSFGLAKERFRKIIVPLAVPMLCGPGSLTTVLLYGARAGNLLTHAALSGVLITSFFMLYLVLAFSYKLEAKVDNLFFVTFTRIFGIIVAAIAMQFVVEGLGEIFPAWLGTDSPIED